MLLCFSKTKERTFLTTNLEVAFKIRLNKREFILKKTLKEFSFVLVLLKLKLKLKFMYI